MKDCSLMPKVVICDQGPRNPGCKALLNVIDEYFFEYSDHMSMIEYIFYKKQQPYKKH